MGKAGKKTEVETTCGIVCSGEFLTPAFPLDPLSPLPSVSGSVSIRSNDWPRMPRDQRGLPTGVSTAQPDDSH